MGNGKHVLQFVVDDQEFNQIIALSERFNLDRPTTCSYLLRNTLNRLRLEEGVENAEQ